jgi:hypothetical protein
VSGRPAAVLDLRGTPMPEHMHAAAAAVERAVAEGELTLLTDQQAVVLYVPSTAAQRGLRSLCRRHTGDGEGWEIRLGRSASPQDAPPPNDESPSQDEED